MLLRIRHRTKSRIVRPDHPACEPPAPYVTDQAAITGKLPGLVGETTYYYRIVAKNLNGTARGAIKSITPQT